MKCLVAVCLRVVEPFAEAVGVTLVNLRQRDVDVETLVYLLVEICRCEDDANGKDVVNLVEGNVLCLHLVPDRVGTLHSLYELVFQSHVVKSLADGGGEFLEQFVALSGGVLELFLYLGVFLGMFKAETEIFQFRLYLVQSQSVSQWGIDIQRLTRYLVLLVGGLRLQCAHVVQTVAYLYKNNADVLAHGEQQFLEVLCLSRCLLAEYSSRNLCQSVDNLCYLRSEDVAYVLNSVVGIFYNVVEKCRTDAGGAQTYLFAGDTCHRYGVHDVGFSRQSAHSLVSLFGKVESLCYEVYLLAVR